MSSTAEQYRATRRQHFLESAEDYTELIADLIATSGEARTGKIAESLGISHVTAVRTLKRLARDGYVITKRHGPILLTPKGQKTAAFCKHRHQVLYAFLCKLGVPSKIAAIDVEGIEHHISKESLACIMKFVG